MIGLPLKQIALPLYEARGWMKSLGVVMLVIGIVTALSIVGIVIAWLPIWLGVLLFQAAGRIETAFATEDAGLFRESLAKLKTSFVIQSVLLLIYLVGVAMVLLTMAVVGVNALWLPFLCWPSSPILSLQSHHR